MPSSRRAGPGLSPESEPACWNALEPELFLVTHLPAITDAPRAIEARSGLDPWRTAELPRAPRPQGLGWFSALGPGVIALGVSIGSGEFLLGPAALMKY